MAVIEIRNVTKQFRPRTAARVLLGRGGLGDLLSGRKRSLLTALKDISFAVDPGESVGLIGANGSGKSTLLKVIAGVTLPTSGDVTVHGRVASLLELGAGFHPMLTGRENVYLNAGLLGVRHADVDKVFDQIVAFSGLEAFIDNPVDTYSSGMYVRLGFAVAVHTNPDVFLVDEVLSVGDEAFQRKCRARIDELKEQGKTIVFVSHDLGIVSALCDRVILLHKGEMVVRRTPSETIDYYLRQVGSEDSVHTLTDQATEAVVNSGRVSLFHNQREVTAGLGFQVHLESMGAWHESVAGDWRVTERSEKHMVARGRMARLPVTQVWKLRFEEGKLHWDIALECERPFPLEDVEANLFFPATYARWIYEDLVGEFPEILPAEHSWTAVVPPNLQCRQAGALPREGLELPIPLVRFEPRVPSLRMQWLNTDYGTGCRVLQVGARVPAGDPLRGKGHHDLMTLVIDVRPASEETALATTREAERALTAGPVTATFRQGMIALTRDDEPITKPFHVSTGIVVANLLTESQNLQWGPVEREGGRITVVGESRRLPFRQQWELAPFDGGVGVKVWLEVVEALEVQDFHVSVHLRPEYEEWATGQESGRFPDLAPERADGYAANRDLSPSSWIRALSSSLPGVRISVRNFGADRAEVANRNSNLRLPSRLRLEVTDCLPFRMAALSSRYEHQAHILQAFVVSEQGALQFESGRHLLFSGAITIGQDECE